MPNRALRRQRKAKFKRGWTPMLVSDTKNWKWVNYEVEGERFRLRPLTDAEYQEASDAIFDSFIEKQKKMGAEIVAALQDTNRLSAAAAVQAQKKDTLSPQIAIKYAVREWSYDAPCDDEHKAELDHATQTFLHDAIVEMNQLRPLLNLKGLSGPSIMEDESHSTSPTSITPGEAEQQSASRNGLSLVGDINKTT